MLLFSPNHAIYIVTLNIGLLPPPPHFEPNVRCIAHGSWFARLQYYYSIICVISHSNDLMCMTHYNVTGKGRHLNIAWLKGTSCAVFDQSVGPMLVAEQDQGHLRSK